MNPAHTPARRGQRDTAMAVRLAATASDPACRRGEARSTTATAAGRYALLLLAVLLASQPAAAETGTGACSRENLRRLGLEARKSMSEGNFDRAARLMTHAAECRRTDGRNGTR